LLHLAHIVETSDPNDADGSGLAALAAFDFALARATARKPRASLSRRNASPARSRALTGCYGLEHLDELLALRKLKRPGTDAYQLHHSFVSLRAIAAAMAGRRQLARG
jgi:hypothetical protein